MSDPGRIMEEITLEPEHPDYLIAPSILSADFARLGEEVDAVLEAGADLIHFDVMDNHYVPNLTIGPMVCRSLRDYGVTAPIDVHLMVKPVDRLIGEFVEAGANYITFHPEATENPGLSLEQVRSGGAKCGLALGPATPLSCLDDLLDRIDMVLIMAVEPGFGGQTFIPATFEKLKAAGKRIAESGCAIRLEIDGGVNVDNIRAIAEAGADTFVAGSAIFGADDYRSAIATMRAELRRRGGF